MRIVDLFAGIGGLRTGVVNALTEAGIQSEVVFTSEIKKHAVLTLSANHPNEVISGDITQVDEKSIPEHEILLAGFPCQAFSFAGSRRGFADETKGTLFFDVARIIKEKRPEYFILENVPGLIHHDPDPEHPKRGHGRTFQTILDTLRSLGYHVDWRLLSATDYGVPQARQRVFITGSKSNTNDLSKLVTTPSKPVSSILEQGKTESDTKVKALSDNLINRYPISYLYGKTIRDKRGGPNNIHSWDIEAKGPTTAGERHLMDEFRMQTRRKYWSILKGHPKKQENTPLTFADIKTFASPSSEQTLEEMLGNLSRQKYLLYENGTYRLYSGRLSFPLSHIVHPEKYTQTLVATDADRLGIVDSGHIRRFTDTEIKRLFGFADDFILPSNVTRKMIFDLFGNSVVIPVAHAVAKSLIC